MSSASACATRAYLQSSLPPPFAAGHTDIFAKADPSIVACSGFLPWDGLGWGVGTWW